VLPGTQQKIQKMITTNGGVYMDMRGLEMNASHFMNLDHMNEEGARRFTEALAQLINEGDLLDRRANDPSRRNVEVEGLTGVRLVEGVLQNEQPKVQFTAPPRAVPRAERPFLQGHAKGRVYFDTEGWGGLSDIATLRRTPFADRCSPLRVLEDGLPLPLSNVSCDEVFEYHAGRMCHMDDKVYFSASDDSNPMDNGRKYKLGLDPARGCESALWLYPGDKVSVPIDTAQLADLEHGMSALRVNGMVMKGPKDDGRTLSIKLVVDGEQRLDEQVDLPTLKGAPHRWSLSPPVASSASNVHVVLSNPTQSFLLLTSVALRERMPPPHDQSVDIP